MGCDVAALEAELNDFDPRRRRAAVEQLAEAVRCGEISLPAPRPVVNLHQHSFFSFNGYGYSPSYLAWRSRKEGLLAAGVVDFDVLDAADEFLDAGRRFGIRTTVGIETRVFFPPFAEKVLNSPGEPGIAYYMGSGFISKEVADPEMLGRLKEIAQRRNVTMLHRVNPYLKPVEIDYDKDVLPLTPSGNPTERHLCMAYDAKAREVFGDTPRLTAFWQEKLGEDAETIRDALKNPPIIQGLIRARTMKAGGVGYVKPDGPDFPPLEHMAGFAARAGALPMYAWLDGTTDGEVDPDQLLDLMTAAGTVAVNIIPDRNWNIKDPETRKGKVAALHRFVDAARDRGLPISVGTEMNAYGQPFVDQFEAPELAPVAQEFVRGALILYGHTVLQRAGGMGYVSDWAHNRFRSVHDKNDFFAKVGEAVHPECSESVSNLHSAMSPGDVLARLDNQVRLEQRGGR